MAYNEFAYFYDELNGEADYDALYRAADQAMYQAKGQGKDCYSFAGRE